MSDSTIGMQSVMIYMLVSPQDPAEFGGTGSLRGVGAGDPKFAAAAYEKACYGKKIQRLAAWIGMSERADWRRGTNAVIPGNGMRAEQIRRYELLASKTDSSYPRRRSVPPVQGFLRPDVSCGIRKEGQRR